MVFSCQHGISCDNCRLSTANLSITSLSVDADITLLSDLSVRVRDGFQTFYKDFLSNKERVPFYSICGKYSERMRISDSDKLVC